MHILDTDTLTHLHAGHPRVIARLRELADPEVGTTIITTTELLRGRFDFVLKAATGQELLAAQRLLQRTEELLAQVIVVPFNNETGVSGGTSVRCFAALSMADRPACEK